MFLSITHKLCAESEADFDVSEAGMPLQRLPLRPDLDSMHSLTRYFVHFRRDRVSAVAGEPIHTRGTRKWVSADLAGRTARRFHSRRSRCEYTSRLPSNCVDCEHFQATECSPFSIGTRVGLIFS